MPPHGSNALCMLIRHHMHVACTPFCDCRRPKVFYETLLNEQFSSAQEPEAGHYFERLTVPVFGANANLPVAGVTLPVSAVTPS